MTKTNRTAKPICQACNRPFDPASPGATRAMGPTCARRAGWRADDESDWQLSFDGDLGEIRRAQSKPAAYRLRSVTLPAGLAERYALAKMAFDELFRAHCNNGTLMRGESADEWERDLMIQDFEVHALADANLTWLEPEHQLKLLIDPASGLVYHHRTINDVVTLLEIDPRDSLAARAHVDTILDFTRAMRAFRQDESATQLSLFPLGETIPDSEL